MAQAKKELFNSELQVYSDYCKALAHPARLAILRFLAEKKMCITGDISNELPLGRTTVNQHLLELKRVGLIVGQIQGTRTNYCLNPGKMKELKNSLAALVEEIGLNPDPACC